MLIRLLVAAPEPELARRIAGLVTGPEMLVRVVAPGADPAAEAAREPCDALVVSSLADDALEELVRPLRELSHPPEVIVLSPRADAEAEAAVVAAGGLAVLRTSVEDEALAAALAALVERVRERQLALTELALAPDPDDLVAKSPSMRKLIDTARRVAKADTPVLILGETGVGKERIANFVHAQSPRREGPFIALNCAAIPAELVESELFGHERGAFTGAHRTRRGYFELAHGGSLFLDEIAELPLPIQAKLLRALQERRIRSVGGGKEIDVDVRVLAATNRSLTAEMERGQFRRDLYYRIGVVELEIPPLRERQADMEALLDQHLVAFSTRFGRELSGFTAPARHALLSYGWPGNIRELINVVERAVLLCLGDSIDLEDLPRSIVAASPIAAPMLDAPEDPVGLGVAQLARALSHKPWKEVRVALLEQGERAYISALLTRHEGRIGRSAKDAGMSERALFDKMKRLGLKKEDFRPRPLPAGRTASVSKPDAKS